LNILLLSDHFLPAIGGGEFVVHYWAKALTNRGHHVVVPTLKPLVRKFEESMRFEYEVDRFPHIPYAPMLSRIVQFYLLHRKYKLDIIHANFLYKAGYVGLRLQKLFRIPCVATAQGADIHVYEGTGYGNIRDPKVRRRTQKVIRDLSGLIYTSEKIRRSIVELGGAETKMHYVVNGSPYSSIVSSQREILRKKMGLTENDLMFLVVSRHSPVKGLSLVVDAVSRLPKTSRKFKVVLAGLRTEQLEPMIREKHLSDKFEIAGTLPIEIDAETNIPKMPSQAIVDYLCAADVFLAPALSGGFELSAMDAMSAGLAIIISENIGNQDLITDGQNGFVVENNSAEKISEAMQALLENPEMAKNMGRINRTLAKQYDWDCIGQQLENVYSQTIQKWKLN
jgi:glycosyltransferase involved in cell wall biosynthesis